MGKQSLYNHLKIEKKWRKHWESKKTYQTENTKNKIKFYVLDMFPYPSGAGLHVGHPRGYIASDVYARFKRMQGFNVLHPMGFDSFGLPAEQYAIQTGKHPGPFTETLIKKYKDQLQSILFSYDWDREVSTHRPEYYKWTQWIFLKLYEHYYDLKEGKAMPITQLILELEKNGNAKVQAFCNQKTPKISKVDWKSFSDLEKQSFLMNYRIAYEGYAAVNWCAELGTVLANDEIMLDKDGKMTSERGGYPVIRKEMRQWFMRITAYADRLISGLDEIDWSNSVKEIERNWIGKSEGSEISFALVGESGEELGNVSVFTTRADTLFGVTYVVLAPEHELVKTIFNSVKNSKQVDAYISKVTALTEQDRVSDEKEKTGIELKGVFAINPANNEKVPVWVADYVLASYGTGAVMAVPAHDERDFEFAKKYKLPIKQVVMPDLLDTKNPPVKGKKNTTRETVHVILRNKKKKTVLVQFLKGEKWKGNEPRGFVIGGMEEGEDEVETAKREVREETGYTNISFVEKIQLDTQANFFAAHKDVNRKIHVRTLVFDLVNEEKVEIEYDEHFTKDSHEMKWIPYDKVAETITIPDDTLAWKYYSIGGFAYVGDGVLNNSGQFSGEITVDARKKITEFVKGKLVTKYKMRDAIFARQRYWGEPIPLRYDASGIIHLLDEKELPLELPKVKSYQPSGNGESPLSGVKSWVKDGYETNTMPGWAGSSWYFLRYMDPKNKKELAARDAIDYWQDVDLYVGGSEHATGHLLYARFWHKFLKDIGVVKSEEPFKVLKNQGMILATDGRKMSKRWGNVINPDDVIATHGADTMRVYESFMGPFESSQPWSTDSIVGSRRFVERVWRLSEKIKEQQSKNIITDEKVLKLLHKTIKKVTEDIQGFAFNTAISSMMVWLNDAERAEKISKTDFIKFIQILGPFAPAVTEEIWEIFGNKGSVHKSTWPEFDSKLILETEVNIAIQVNGKLRAEMTLAPDATEDEATTLALAHPNVQKFISGQKPKKIIFIKGRIINIVV